MASCVPVVFNVAILKGATAGASLGLAAGLASICKQIRIYIVKRRDGKPPDVKVHITPLQATRPSAAFRRDELAKGTLQEQQVPARQARFGFSIRSLFRPLQAASGAPQEPPRVGELEELVRKFLGPVNEQLPVQPFLVLLKRLVAETRRLQHNHNLGKKPKERLAATIILDELACYGQKHGPLDIKEIEYEKGRTNLRITYRGEGPGTVAFVGAHFDVLPLRDHLPKADLGALSRVGDRLVGRGTSSCLGHIALLTQLLIELCRVRPKLQRSVVVVFFAAREGAEPGIGADELLRQGLLEDLKHGPLFWLDGADSQPCIGTMGSIGWTLKAHGRGSLVGQPQQGINAIELACEAMSFLQAGFYERCPAHEQEPLYKFPAGSTMKPTRMGLCQPSAENRICDEIVIHGDLRVTPFYDIEEVIESIERTVQEFNERIPTWPTRGSFSPLDLDSLSSDAANAAVKPRSRGSVSLVWDDIGAKPDHRDPSSVSKDRIGIGLLMRNGWGDSRGDSERTVCDEGSNVARAKLLAKRLEGVAVDCSSLGHRVLLQALSDVRGSSFVQEVCFDGSVPHVRLFQRNGFDVQLCGFGRLVESANEEESCSLEDMRQGFKVLFRILALMEQVEQKSEEPLASTSVHEEEEEEADFHVLLEQLSTAAPLSRPSPATLRRVRSTGPDAIGEDASAESSAALLEVAFPVVGCARGRPCSSSPSRVAPLSPRQILRRPASVPRRKFLTAPSPVSSTQLVGAVVGPLRLAKGVAVEATVKAMEVELPAIFLNCFGPSKRKSSSVGDALEDREDLDVEGGVLGGGPQRPPSQSPELRMQRVGSGGRAACGGYGGLVGARAGTSRRRASTPGPSEATPSQSCMRASGIIVVRSSSKRSSAGSAATGPPALATPKHSTQPTLCGTSQPSRLIRPASPRRHTPLQPPLAVRGGTQQRDTEKDSATSPKSSASHEERLQAPGTLAEAAREAEQQDLSLASPAPPAPPAPPLLSASMAPVARPSLRTRATPVSALQGRGPRRTPARL